MTAGLALRNGYLEVDCGRSDPRELSDLYRTFAVECLKQQTRRALVKALDCDPDGHHALRDALTTMILAGLPSGFRIALLANVGRLEVLFGELQGDLARLEVPAALFRDEARATTWLGAKAAAPSTTEEHSARQQQA